MFTIIGIGLIITYWRQIVISLACFVGLFLLIFILVHHRSKKRAQAYAAEMARRAAEMRFIGNKKSLVFHRPDCHVVRGIPVDQLVWFKSSAQAIGCDFKPCGVCKPWD